MIQVHDTIAGFRKALDAERHAGRTVGLVPTMGYLHEGHASLMRRAAAENDVAAATIFVNPLQFAPTEDLASYPRDLDRDLQLAEGTGVAHVLAPSVEEMYPDGVPLLTTVSVDAVSEGMEGASRLGHFAGVATVVAKLFAIAGPCRAYFGEKDYQQLVVIRRMVRDLSFPVEVVPCPTIREPDGLAMSSRNVYLSDAERTAAAVLHRALQTGKSLIEHEGIHDPEAIRQAMAAVVAEEPLAQLDYAEAVSADDLRTTESLSGEVRLLIAARLGPARLIDNLGATA